MATTKHTQHTRQMRRVPAKIYRTPLRVMVAMPMPGLEPTDISVEITSSPALVIRGRQRGELKGLKDELLNEWSAGDYERMIALPIAVDGELANVTYGNGVLVVALPIASQTRPAHLTLSALSATRGLRAGNMGRPIRPYARG
jgi:HSP20 family protein